MLHHVGVGVDDFRFLFFRNYEVQNKIRSGSKLPIPYHRIPNFRIGFLFKISIMIFPYRKLAENHENLWTRQVTKLNGSTTYICEMINCNGLIFDFSTHYDHCWKWLKVELAFNYSAQEFFFKKAIDGLANAKYVWIVHVQYVYKHFYIVSLLYNLCNCILLALCIIPRWPSKFRQDVNFAMIS